MNKLLRTLISSGMVMGAIGFTPLAIAYTITVNNTTKDKILVKGNLIGLDQDAEVAAESTQTISTGLKCINAIEVRSKDTTVKREIEGWCLIPGITNKSKSWDVYVQYAQTNDRGIGSGLNVELR